MRKILVLSADGFEDLELFYPYHRLQEEGYVVEIASVKKGVITGKRGYSVEASLSFSEAKPSEYDGIVIPGGKGPEKVRLDADALRITRFFFEQGKPVATICHGPQVLISANVVRGKRLTSWPGIKDDVIAAGGLWVDEPVVVDGNLVSSRHPGDLAYWMREYVKLLKTSAQPPL